MMLTDRELVRGGAMRALENKHGWNPISTAPFDQDVMLEVSDGRGEPYRLHNPSRLTASGWVSSSKGTPLVVTPVKWKPLNSGLVRLRR
jgi:hypothetical protein